MVLESQLLVEKKLEDLLKEVEFLQYITVKGRE